MYNKDGYTSLRKTYAGKEGLQMQKTENILEEIVEPKISKKAQILADYLMEFAQGEQNAITAKRLKSMGFGTGVHIRAIVNSLRVNGYPICSSKNGYFFAQNKAEILQTINNLRSRMESIREAFFGLMDCYDSYDNEPEHHPEELM
jgi:hypothetical protein